MGTITTGTGLISGLDTKSIIDQLIAIEGRQKDLVQAKVDTATAQKTAFVDLQTRLTSLNITSQQIAKPSFFQNAKATSTNEDVMTATAAAGAAVGSYQFRVARLVQSEQLVSGNFGDPDKSLVGAGTLTVELGGGQVTQQNNLNDLRGGQGVSRGEVRVTDRAGHSTVIDFSDAVTLDDVVKKFNTSVDVSIKASVVNNTLQLTDATGLPGGSLTVQDLGGKTTAADLGVAGTSAAALGGTTSLAYVGRATRLATLNDGNGVADGTGNDFTITAKDGTSINVDLKGAATVGDAIDTINAAAGTKVVASVSTDGKGITLTDSTGGGNAFSVIAANGSTAAADLGLTAAATGSSITGKPVIGALGTVMLKTLNGGNGLTLTSIHVKGRGGGEADVDLSTATTLQDVLDKLNNSGVGIKAEVNNSGNGIQLTDTTGGTGDLVITDNNGGNSSSALGIGGTFTAATPVVNGANLQRKWVSGGTTLADYNGGKGVAAGQFTIQSADGNKQTIEVDPDTDLTLADVVAKINSKFKINGRQVITAGINAKGDGLMLTDNSTNAATGVMSVEEKGGTTATNLNLIGKSKAGVIDGSMEKTIEVTATDTLTDVQKKIQNLSFGLSATIISDGSGASGNRLSLTSTNAGLAGQVTFDAGTTKLGTRTLVAAQNAAVFVGSGEAGEPMLITSSKNVVSNAIKGVTLNLTSASKDPVTISVANDVENVSEALQTFTDNYNALIDKLDTYTSFRVDNDTSDDGYVADENGNKTDPNSGTRTTKTSDGTTYRKGVLLGDYGVSQVEDQLAAMIQTVVPEGGSFASLARVGISLTDGRKLEFDADKFNEAWATDSNAVKSLFTTTSAAINNDTQLRFLNGGNGITTVGDGKDDFEATLKDGSKVKVSVGDVDTVGQILTTINAQGQGKLTAELDSNYKIILTDRTAGTTAAKITQLNSSQFLSQIGMSTDPTDGKYTGKKLVSNDPLASAKGGIGVQFQQKINDLINPVDGLIPTESKTIDDKITQYQTRITDLNDMLDQKRTRLEKQFNNLESVLSKLRTQQSSLGSITSMSAA